MMAVMISPLTLRSPVARGNSSLLSRWMRRKRTRTAIISRGICRRRTSTTRSSTTMRVMMTISKVTWIKRAALECTHTIAVTGQEGPGCREVSGKQIRLMRWTTRKSSPRCPTTRVNFNLKENVTLTINASTGNLKRAPKRRSTRTSTALRVRAIGITTTYPTNQRAAIRKSQAKFESKIFLASHHSQLTPEGTQVL